MRRLFRTVRLALILALLLTTVAGPTRIGATDPAPEISPGTTAVVLAGDEQVATLVPLPAALTAPHIASTQFLMTYVDFPPEALAAFQYAIDIWSSLLTSPVPIRVHAVWEPLGPGVLGAASTGYEIRNFAGPPQRYVRYPAALANKLAGHDLVTGADDIQASFNSDDASKWYFGTGATPANQYSFVGVVLHELGHGLGFLGNLHVEYSYAIGSSPDIYDRFAVDGAGRHLLDTTVYPDQSAALAAALQGGTVRFAGPAATAAAGGVAPRLYTPAQWQNGSSYSHLDEATYRAGDPNALMTPQVAPGEAIYSPGPIALGILADLGWGPSPLPAPPAGPFNDRFPGAPLNQSAADIDTGAATAQPGEPTAGCGTGPVGKTAWYSVTPPLDGTLTLSTGGSDFDTVLAAYTGDSVDGLIPVPGACNDDDFALESRLRFGVQAGTTYRIQAGGYAGASGHLALAATFNPTPFTPIPPDTTGALLRLATRGAGSLLLAPPPASTLAPRLYRYTPGTVVTMTASPGVGQTFVGWLVDGRFVGWRTALAVTMDTNHKIMMTFAPTGSFPDVGSARPDRIAIKELVARGAIRGYADGRFGPDDGLSRAQLAALIARATPQGAVDPAHALAPPLCLVAGTWDCEGWGTAFTDRAGLDGDLWRAIGTLQHYGVASGYDRTIFGPNDPATYVETLVVVTRAMIAKGYWLAWPAASQPYTGIPAVFLPEVATFHFYTQGAGGIPAPPADWNATATRGWFARALWVALDTYWGTEGLLPDGRPAGGYVP